MLGMGEGVVVFLILEELVVFEVVCIVELDVVPAVVVVLHTRG